MNSKNQRKFRIWDNTSIYQSYEQAAQIMFNIEQVCGDAQNPEDLPKSVIPSEVLYDIAAHYVAMYEKLLEEELITCGYPKSTTTKH